MNKADSESKRLVVMTICHYDKTNPIGGLEKQARALSFALSDAGENVVVLSSTRDPAQARWFTDGNVAVRLFWTYASPQVAGRYFPASVLWGLQVFWWIVANRREIAVLHGHQIRIHAFAMALAGKLFKLPVILKSATGGAGADILTIGSRKYFGKAGRHFVIANTDTFVATTSSIRDDLVANGVSSDAIEVIPNGIHIMPAGVLVPTEDRARRCLFLGRLAPDKNVLPLATAALAVADHSGLQIDFWGEGPEQGELEALLSKANNRQVSYRGFTENPVDLLGQYGWLLLPSDAEGLSNAMIEAMAYGVVPITTKVSGCVDHIRPMETGLFFESTTVEDLERRLRGVAEISAAEWKKMSEQALRHARGQFAFPAVVSAYKALYARLQADHRMPQDKVGQL